MDTDGPFQKFALVDSVKNDRSQDHRSARRVLVLTCLLAALQGCVSSPSPTWAEPGVAVVGRVVRTERAQIWEGDVPGEGRVYWLETGPPTEIVAFGSFQDCPATNAGDDRYVVMLVRRRMGFVLEDQSAEKIAPSAFAIACARLDPQMSVFPKWRPQP